jgi:hypothetical protein
VPASEWTPVEVVGLFFAFVAVAAVALRVLVHRARRKLRLRHQVVEPWLPLARALAAGGAADPGLVALALAGWQLELQAPAAPRARLAAGVATVADALGLPLLEVQQAVLARSGEDGEAAIALEELRALGARLAGMPGVKAVGELWPGDAETLARTVRRYAQMCAVPPPRR